jgi:orotate phosphoribosyltransferase
VTDVWKGRAAQLRLVGDEPHEVLRQLIKQLAVIPGEVTLASGRQASYYVDLRRITLHHRAAPIMGHLMLNLLEDRGLLAGDDFTAVGGLTMGADPVATAMLHVAALRGLKLDSFVVRKDAKTHGLQRRIEGPDVAGCHVVVVEDTSTTGGSIITAVEALRQAGATVEAVAVIVDRATGAADKIKAMDLPYHHLYGLNDLDLAVEG